ncbi:MAG TPA: hypothetical protein VGG07_06320 [Solirubrobacteraceae bacterium]
MHRISRRMVAVLVVIGAIAAGGAAFTAANTLPPSTAGYGSSTVSGATATDIVYGLSTDGTQINSATITFTGDLSNDTVKAGFETTDLSTCTAPVFASGSSTSTCSGYTESTAGSTTFNVAVTNN